MTTFFIRREPVSGPTITLDESPRLVHPHPAAVEKLDDRLLWRYLDLAKYLSLLHHSALYFTRADALSEMDPMERSWGIPDIEEHRGEPAADEWARVRKSLYDIMGKYYVCCWHLSQYESAAMWELYGTVGQSVAIQTSLQRMCSALSTEDAMDALHWRIFPLQVQYLDYSKEGVGKDNALHLLRSKRKSYEHEREVRFALMPPAALNTDDVGGALLPVRLPDIIEAVYVAPRAPKWVRELITNVTERYGLPGNIVHQSALAGGPLV